MHDAMLVRIIVCKRNNIFNITLKIQYKQIKTPVNLIPGGDNGQQFFFEGVRNAVNDYP